MEKATFYYERLVYVYVTAAMKTTVVCCNMNMNLCIFSVSGV